LNAINTIAVKVDNTNSENIAPLSADFTFCGGIIRPVNLIVADPVSISLTDYASSGVYVTQTNVTNASANVNVRVLLQNATSSSRTISRTINIKDPGNVIVATKSDQVTLAPNSTTSNTTLFTLSNPKLWNGKLNPQLYKAEVILKENTVIRDSLTQPFGLRYFEVKKDSGFYLNGKRYPLYGVNHHEDRLDKGRAISNSDRLEDFKIMKDLGVSFIRLSHYQHGDYIYDLADQQGIILWTEIPLINSIVTTTLFSSNIKEQLKELIRQNYNHPSVFFWGLYNEILQKEGPDPLALTQELNILAHQEDPTRLTAVASNKDNMPVNLVADLVSFNKYYGWYYNTPAGFTEWVNQLKASPLPIPAGVSEYGAGASILHHELYPAMPVQSTNWHPEELQNVFHEKYWSTIKKYPSLWQTSLWLAFDFASDGRSEGDHPGINDKGLVTHDRKTKKDAFYYYKSHWNKEPMAYITSRRFSERTDAITYIKVYSNCDSVKLTVNKNTYRTLKPSENVCNWDNIILDPGVNMITARGYKNKTVYSDSCIWRYDISKADKSVRLNFQASSIQTPLYYLSDTGAIYGPKANGISYGWNVNNISNARERNLWPDKLYDGFNHFQKNTPDNFWEAGVKNGTYLVHLVAGDPGSYDGNMKLMAENKLIVDGTPSREKPWIVNQDTVTVKDGRLTIRAAPGAVNSKISFIHFTRIDSSNLALGRKVTQSSTVYNGNPSRAIDGNTDGAWNNGSVTHTNNEANAWWEIDLGNIHKLSTIRIWNRTDACCKTKMANYYVFVSDVPFESKQLSITLNQPGVWKVNRTDYPNPATSFTVNRTGRYIRIQLAGTSTLSLAEVQIMGTLQLAPAAPSELKASSGGVKNTLTWMDNSNNETGFIIEKKLGDSNFEELRKLDSNIRTFSDSANFVPGKTYSYRVKGYNNEGTSAYSNEATVTIPVDNVSENLALKKPATQSSISYGGIPERAVDGNTNGLWQNASVIHTYPDANAWWEVDLGGVYNISTIQIWNRTNTCCNSRLSNYYVLVSSDPFQSKSLAATLAQPGVWQHFETAYPNPSSTVDVNNYGRYIRIQLSGTAELNIAEVIVLGNNVNQPVNVALNKPATQSSTSYGGLAARAVDGNTSGLWEKGSVTHTSNNLNAWWEVDLQNSYQITSIELWNRTNACCIARLSNYYLFISENPFQSKDLNVTLNQPGVWNTFETTYPNPSKTFPISSAGRFLRVQLAGTGELNIAEFMAFGWLSAKKSGTLESTSITKLSDSLQLSVYPVPFRDVLKVESNKTLKKTELITMMGETLLSADCKGTSTEMNTESLKPGYYILRILTSDNQYKTVPVIKH
jgi:beta-galactosidase